MYLTTKTIKIGNKKRKITICPPELQPKYYAIHLKLSNLFEEHDASQYVHCRIGRSVITNAMPHIGHSFTVKMDIKNFFYNVTLNNHGWCIPAEFHGIIFINERLPQGLPSSPSAANLAFALTDLRIAEFCEEYGITYTRYCDDLSFSFNEYGLVKEIKQNIQDIVKKQCFQINSNKTKVLYAKAGRRIICGVGVGEDNIYPTRKSKRNLRTFQKNGQKLAAQGMQAWINQIEKS